MNSYENTLYLNDLNKVKVFTFIDEALTELNNFKDNEYSLSDINYWMDLLEIKDIYNESSNEGNEELRNRSDIKLAKRLRHLLILNFTLIQSSKERNEYLLDKKEKLKIIIENNIFTDKGDKDIKYGISKIPA